MLRLSKIFISSGQVMKIHLHCEVQKHLILVWVGYAINLSHIAPLDLVQEVPVLSLVHIKFLNHRPADK